VVPLVRKGAQSKSNGKFKIPHLVASPWQHFKCRENTVAALLDSIYPEIQTVNHPNQYFSERTILSSKNADVDSLNKQVLQKFPGHCQVC